MKILTKPNRIDFLDERFYHVADKDGQPIYFPSVTSILNEFGKGYGFNQWLMDVGSNSAIIANRAAESGSIVHEALHQLALGVEINWNDKVIGDYKYHSDHYSLEEWKGILKFKEFVDQTQPTGFNPESMVYSLNNKYAGTVDLVCDINGETYLIDYKFGENIYETAFLQVSAYAKAVEELGRKIDKVGVLHLKAKTRGADKRGKVIQGNGWKLATHKYSIDQLFETFLAVKKIYDYKVSIGELPDKPANKSYETKVKLTLKT